VGRRRRHRPRASAPLAPRWRARPSTRRPWWASSASHYRVGRQARSPAARGVAPPWRVATARRTATGRWPTPAPQGRPTRTVGRSRRGADARHGRAWRVGGSAGDAGADDRRDARRDGRGRVVLRGTALVKDGVWGVASALAAVWLWGGWPRRSTQRRAGAGAGPCARRGERLCRRAQSSWLVFSFFFFLCFVFSSASAVRWAHYCATRQVPVHWLDAMVFSPQRHLGGPAKRPAARRKRDPDGTSRFEHLGVPPPLPPRPPTPDTAGPSPTRRARVGAAGSPRRTTP